MLAVLAQITNPALQNALGGSGTKPIGQVIGNLLSALIGVSLILGFLTSFFFLITGGITWITAGGDKGKLQESRDHIIQALIGLIILAASWAIFDLVAGWVGLDLQALPIPKISAPPAGPPEPPSCPYPPCPIPT